uniref:Uncharacterized protein n=1 Tax=Arundo donax TaxID=35708 RepID=A0A0A9BQL1_ARUDO
MNWKGGFEGEGHQGVGWREKARPTANSGKNL